MQLIYLAFIDLTTFLNYKALFEWDFSYKFTISIYLMYATLK